MDQDTQDSTEGCVHADAVKWNPFNNVVQCHRCGTIFLPEVGPRLDAMDLRMNDIARRLYRLEGLPGVRELIPDEGD